MVKLEPDPTVQGVRPIGIRTRNAAEIRVAQDLEADGWKIYKRGWPDFLAVRGDEVRFVEVKPNRFSSPSRHQKAVAAVLREHYGIKVEVVFPAGLPHTVERNTSSYAQTMRVRKGKPVIRRNRGHPDLSDAEMLRIQEDAKELDHGKVEAMVAAGHFRDRPSTPSGSGSLGGLQ